MLFAFLFHILVDNVVTPGTKLAALPPSETAETHLSCVCGEIKHCSLPSLILCVFCGSTVHPKCAFRLKDNEAWTSLLQLTDFYKY